MNLINKIIYSCNQSVLNKVPLFTIYTQYRITPSCTNRVANNFFNKINFQYAIFDVVILNSLIVFSNLYKKYVIRNVYFIGSLWFHCLVGL